MNTLIYHYGALGDFLTTLPALAAWKRLHKSKITLLGKPSLGYLAHKAGYIDTIEDADSGKMQFLFLEDSEPAKLTHYLAAFDALLLFAAPDAPLSVNACRHGQAQLLIQQPFPMGRIHIADYHLSLIIPPAELTMLQRTPAIYFDADGTNPQSDPTGGKNGPVIAIHPGSGSARKNWPLSCFLNVAESLRREGYTIAWFTGPAENVFDFPAGDFREAGRPLDICAQLLSRCAAFLGNDSGMTHLAAAVGCPTVALFGPSDPAVWGPRGRGPVRIIYYPPDCAPCHPAIGLSPRCAGECMNRICPQEVLAALREVLGACASPKGRMNFPSEAGGMYFPPER